MLVVSGNGYLCWATGTRVLPISNVPESDAWAECGETAMCVERQGPGVLPIPSVPESDARPECGETAMCVEGDKDLSVLAHPQQEWSLNSLPLPLPPVN